MTEKTNPEHVYFQFVVGDAFGRNESKVRIRKWDVSKFEEGIEYIRADLATTSPAVVRSYAPISDEAIRDIMSCVDVSTARIKISRLIYNATRPALASSIKQAEPVAWVSLASLQSLEKDGSHIAVRTAIHKNLCEAAMGCHSTLTHPPQTLGLGASPQTPRSFGALCKRQLIPFKTTSLTRTAATLGRKTAAQWARWTSTATGVTAVLILR